MDIVAALKEYRINRAKLKMLECELLGLDMQYTQKMNEFEALDGYRGKEISHTSYIHGGRNDGSTVESDVIRREELAQGIQTLYRNKEELQGQINEVRRLVEPVEILLGALSDDERFVVENFDIAGNTWNRVSEIYRKEWGYHITRKALWAKRKIALKKIGNILTREQKGNKNRTF